MHFRRRAYRGRIRISSSFVLKAIIAVLLVILTVFIVLYLTRQSHVVYTQDGVQYSWSESDTQADSSESDEIRIVFDSSSSG